MTTATTRRERLRRELDGEVKRVALQHLASEGGELSMRAVARDVGISPQGLYRYYESRDALLTRLIGDAYDALADALVSARDAADVPAGAPDSRAVLGARMAAAATAYRAWSLAHPAEFALVMGGPVPGYAAPVDGPTTVAARRVTRVFLDVTAAAHAAGHLRVPAPPPGLGAGFARWQSLTDPDAPPEAVHAVFLAWGRLHGPVALEAFGHLAALGDAAGELFAEHLDAALRDLGLGDG